MIIKTEDKPEDFAGDAMRGGSEIAEFLFGDKKHRKKVFYLAEQGQLPVFRLGTGGIWARKSTLLGYIRMQEDKVLNPDKSK